MPLGTRREMASQAKVNRRTGMLVWLVIPPATSASTDTPFSISAGDAAVDLTKCTLQKVYAKNASRPGVVSYGEGGKTVLRTATLEIPAEWGDQVQSAYAVKFTDGSIMLKKSENLDDTGTTYIVALESHVNNP